MTTLDKKTLEHFRDFLKIAFKIYLFCADNRQVFFGLLLLVFGLGFFIFGCGDIFKQKWFVPPSQSFS